VFTPKIEIEIEIEIDLGIAYRSIDGWIGGSPEWLWM